MTHGASDIVDTAALAQFLRECEPPTPPASAVSTLNMPSNILWSSGYGQIIPAIPTRTGVLELEEEDRQAILSALDNCSDLKHPLMSFTQALKNPALSPEDKLKIQRAKATARRNRHRQRVKEEWKTLRSQEAQLTAALDRLKRPRFEVSQMKWQVLASKELDARLQAEGQLQRTRMVIERRSDVIQNLQNIINTQQCGKPSEKTEELAPEWGPDDIKLYENFMRDLTEAYTQTDSVLHECGLDGTVTSETSFYKPKQRLDTVRGIAYFESTSAFVMPARYPNSANAMFEATRQVFGGNPRRKLYKTDENTIAVKFGTVYHCEGDTVVPLSLISTQHRFEGPDRTVFAWRCLVEGEGEFTGTCLDETGWCVLRPTSSESDSTDIRTCIRSTPVRRGSDNAIKVEERDEEFATAVIRSSQQDSLKLTQLMDQLLLNSEDNQ